MGSPKRSSRARISMPASERAKLFVPFSALRGLEEALCRAERDVEAGISPNSPTFAQKSERARASRSGQA